MHSVSSIGKSKEKRILIKKKSPGTGKLYRKLLHDILKDGLQCLQVYFIGSISGTIHGVVCSLLSSVDIDLYISSFSTACFHCFLTAASTSATETLKPFSSTQVDTFTSWFRVVFLAVVLAAAFSSTTFFSSTLTSFTSAAFTSVVFGSAVLQQQL